MRIVNYCGLVALWFQTSFALDSSLRVKTSVGTVTGFIDPSLPTVKKWLGVPYAEAPVKSLRFSPPVAKKLSTTVINATKRPSSCAQWLTTKPDIFNVLTPEFLPPAPSSEDCLYLNVIAPKSPKRGDCELPVLVWIHGGEATWGGINTPYEFPEQWVASSQEHIVVQVNYRVNIFGFPNAKGLNQTNLALLDQRLALEWVRDNIKSFGGDPKKITFWGQSAGGSLVDGHNFAFPEDPIFRAVILQSSVILLARTLTDPTKTSFSFVAQQMGCPVNASAAEEVECMRGIDAQKIENFLQAYNDNGTTPALYFSASEDDKIAFSPTEYLNRATTGKGYANVPMLVGSNSEEGSSFVPFSVAGTGVTTASINQLTLRIFQCSISSICKARVASGRTTYRYQYAGNFTNISPAPWLGAYHFAELPLIMGTHSNYRSKSTRFETALSTTMQDLWLAFAKDPLHGLANKGWAPYSPNGTALELGKGSSLTAPLSISVLDSGCT